MRFKKGSRLRLCFWVVDDIPEKNGMDLWKEMSSSKQVSVRLHDYICGIFFALIKPFHETTTTVYTRSAFYPSLRFTLSLQSAVCILHTVCILPLVCSPQSAVRSPQSASYTREFKIRRLRTTNYGWTSVVLCS